MEPTLFETMRARLFHNPYSVPAESISPSVRIRLDSACILLDDGRKSVNEERPSMIDHPEIYYFYVFFNFSRRVPKVVIWILVILTTFEVPAWCQKEELCDVGAYPTMLPVSWMWSTRSFLQMEITCMVAVLCTLSIDRLHRGDSFFNRASGPTMLLWGKFAVASAYTLDIILAFAFISKPGYQQWRLGGYLRAIFFILVHRNTLDIWALHVKMIPNFLEVMFSICFYVLFFAIIAMNVFRDTAEGNHEFSSFSSSIWSLTVLLTTANFPDVFVDSFLQSKVSVLFFVAFLVFGTYGLVYILMATVFSQFKTRIGALHAHAAKCRRVSFAAAFAALCTPAKDPNGPPPLTLNRPTMGQLLDQYASHFSAISPDLKKKMLDLFFEGEGRRVTTPKALDEHLSNEFNAVELSMDELAERAAREQSDCGALEALDEAAFLRFSILLDEALNAPQQWPHELDYIGLGQSRAVRFTHHLITGMKMAVCCTTAKASKVPLFEVVIDVLLFLNMVNYGIEASECSVVRKTRYCGLYALEIFFFNIIFVLELVLKLFGLGARNYVDHVGNNVDLIMTFISTALVAIYWVAEIKTKSAVLEIAIAFRLVRCVRLFKYTSMFDLLSGVVNNIRNSVLGLAGFVFSLYFMGAVLGQQLLGGRICNQKLAFESPRYSGGYICPPEKLVVEMNYDQSRYYDFNFNDPLMSCLSLFLIMVGNNWNDVVDAFVEVTSVRTRAFFVIWYILVVYIALNTTLSFIIETYITEEERQAARKRIASSAL